MKWTKEEDFIFPTGYFEEEQLPSFSDYLIEIPTGRKNKDNK